MKILFISIAVILILVLIGFVVFDLAPAGYEDENGFHYGDPPGAKE